MRVKKLDVCKWRVSVNPVTYQDVVYLHKATLVHVRGRSKNILQAQTLLLNTAIVTINVGYNQATQDCVTALLESINVCECSITDY